MDVKTHVCRQYDLSLYLPFWDGLSPEQRGLLRGCSVKSYSAGEKILFGLSDRNGFLLVLDGGIRVYISSPGGREFTLYRAGRGDFCSLLPMDGQGTPTLEADGECDTIHISLAMLLPMLSCYPETANFFLSRIGSNLQGVLNNIEHTFFSPLKSCIARVILQGCSCESPTIRATHEQIANHVGTTREVVSREIEVFREKGLIATGRGHITVLDRPGLERIAES